MRFEITSPEGKKFEVNAPDGATRDEVLAYAQSQFKPVEPYKPVSPTDDMSGPQKFLAGMGKGFSDLGTGFKQRLGMVTPEQVAEDRRVDQPLMDSGSGFAGSIAGTTAAAIPVAMTLPASLTGAAVTGGVVGALQPTAPGESAAKNTAINTVLGLAGQYGLGKLGQVATNRLTSAEAKGATLASQNAPRDAALQTAQASGYVAPPSVAGGSLPGRVLEGLSGKYKANELAAAKNQNITDTLARKAVGLEPNQAITPEALRDVRTSAYARGYEPVAAVGRVETDSTYQAALDKIASKYEGAAADFPGAASDSVTKFINGTAAAEGKMSGGLRVKDFDAGNAVKMTQILRDEASDAFRAGDSALGKAKRDAARAIEDQIERGIAKSGNDGAELLKNFREARTLMAKTHSVEDALVAEGGRVNAKVLGAALQRGKPLTGDLKTIGAFANNFKDVSGVPKVGATNPFTIMDFGFGTATGSPVLPMARVAARYGILSGPGQKLFAKPDYAPGLLARNAPQTLEELRKLKMGGLLGPSAYAVQQ